MKNTHYLIFLLFWNLFRLLSCRRIEVKLVDLIKNLIQAPQSTIVSYLLKNFITKGSILGGFRETAGC